ncbi:DUF6925 family protein [Amorphus coralli]|uniref:DUF6925 family protein n=1 Tax=Amorphus coralli TaxID=340680 RepID=UPI0003609797|nr:hypothetical protein [Amorphus coralli]
MSELDTRVEPEAFLRGMLRDPRAGWNFGTFGAIAEFLYDADEAVDFSDASSISTRRGAIRIESGTTVRLVAFETPAKNPGSWNHAVALCLPEAECAMNQRTVLTELGPDESAVDPRDREAILFDMGLGTLQADICVRSADPAVIARLRAGCGRSLAEPGNTLMQEMPQLSPNRVFVTKLGRAEVRQRVPRPDERSPEGPHTHVLPQLLRTGRTHAANDPIPDGWVPCGHLHPAHPLKDHYGRTWPFDAAAHAAFQDMLATFGLPGLVAAKRETWEALAAGADEGDLPERSSREERAASRVAVAQYQSLREQGAA